MGARRRWRRRVRGVDMCRAALMFCRVNWILCRRTVNLEYVQDANDWCDYIATTVGLCCGRRGGTGRKERGRKRGGREKSGRDVTMELISGGNCSKSENQWVSESLNLWVFESLILLLESFGFCSFVSLFLIQHHLFVYLFIFLGGVLVFFLTVHLHVESLHCHLVFLSLLSSCWLNAASLRVWWTSLAVDHVADKQREERQCKHLIRIGSRQTLRFIIDMKIETVETAPPPRSFFFLLVSSPYFCFSVLLFFSVRWRNCHFLTCWWIFVAMASVVLMDSSGRTPSSCKSSAPSWISWPSVRRSEQKSAPEPGGLEVQEE